MAARSDASPAAWRGPFLRWLDGIDRGWAVPLLLIAFTGLWLLFFIVAYQGSSLHFDALETWALGREFVWGTEKHPPLMVWVATLWSVVFPLTDWSFQLMAMVNAGLALWAVDLTARRFVRGDKRFLVLLLAMLLPAYQFHAQRFNANTVLLAVWPFAIYFFLRAFETRAVVWSVAAGAFAALAMLGKYYSVFLIAGLALAAMLHPQRTRYFKSSSPWVSSLAGLIVLGPHLHWLTSNYSTIFGHALDVQASITSLQAVRESWMFVLGCLAALALPAVVWALAAGERLAQTKRDFANMDDGLLLLFLIAILLIILPVGTSIVMGTYLPSLWALQGLYLFLLVLVCGANYEIERFYTVNILTVVFGIAIIAVAVAAPLHAISRIDKEANERTYYKGVANEVAAVWRESTPARLEALHGDGGLIFAIAFYGTRQKLLPDNAEAPGVFICHASDSACVAQLNARAAEWSGHRVHQFTVKPQLWGRAGKPADFTALMMLPQSSATGTLPAPEMKTR